MPTLILLRHGKSDYPFGVEDFDRPLAPRGKTEAAEAGRWIDEHLPPVDFVACSDARRTRETLLATGVEAETRYTEAIYGADVLTLLDELQSVQTQAETVLLVGHAPGVQELALFLAGDGSDPESLSEVESRFPTSALAVFDVSSPWPEIGSRSAVLTHFHIARPN